MAALTSRQREVLEFVERTRQQTGFSPTHREIASFFGFRSPKAAADHLRALLRKGALVGQPRQARAIRPANAVTLPPAALDRIPIYGSVPAGFPEDRRQESHACLSVDLASLGIRPTPRTFALQVRGDSMIGRHILEGDYVIVEHGRTPRTGDIVAALIDNESTLKTFVAERGQIWLRAENPRYPKLIPAEELVIQGVMVALIRKARV
jgi:repressor LexA